MSEKVTVVGHEPRQALAALIAGDERGLRCLAELLAPYLPVPEATEPDP